MKRIIATLTIIGTLSLCAVAQDRSGYIGTGTRSDVQTNQDGGGAMGNGHLTTEDGGGALGNGHFVAEDGGGIMGTGTLLSTWNWFSELF